MEIDEVDLGFTRKRGKVRPTKADLLDSFIAVGAIGTYIADVSTDILVAYQYFRDKEWAWFILTTTFIIVPSVIMQAVSSLWYHEDEKKQSALSKLMHLLQLGTVERYFNAFWYGSKTLCSKTINADDFEKYLCNWRDVTMLRLVETFLESGPQVILQLYILSTFKDGITFKNDWLNIIAVVASIASLAWSLVSYAHAARMCHYLKGLSICGYIFQVLYRILMITSRVVALALFASEYKWWIFAAVIFHFLIMIYWVRLEKTDFCGNAVLEFLFQILIAFIYIFCFINAKNGTSRQHVTLYYTLFFLENSVLIAAWYPLRTEKFGLLEYGAISMVWGGFALGLLSMLAYYKFFHPKTDITEGWCYCTCFIKKETVGVSVQGVREEQESNASHPGYIRQRSIIQMSHKKVPVDIELSPRLQTRNKFNHRIDDFEVRYRINDYNHSSSQTDMRNNGYTSWYGTVVQENNEKLNGSLEPAIYGVYV